jgi:hypothetical protein
MKRLLLALIAGAMVFTVAFASAAALQVDASVIQSGGDVDVTCQTGPVTVGYQTTVVGNGEFAVTGITFSGLEPSCDGLTVAVSLIAAPGNSGVTQVGFIGGTLHVSSAGTFSLNDSNDAFKSGFPVPASAIGDVQVLIKSGDL